MSDVTYPLLLRPTLKHKVWGGNHLHQMFGYTDPKTDDIGEAWIVYGQLTVSNGACAGSMLNDLVTAYPEAVLGTRLATENRAEFPLLIKFLDAQDNLSVQVHPDDEYARTREGVPYGKTEAWYILHADADAHIWHGVTRSLEPSELIAQLGRGRINDVLAEVPVHAGDVVMNKAGTIHALGPGIVLYEVQESSDITYRLYDWNRNTGATGRELHLDKGADVSDLNPLPEHTISPITIQGDGFTHSWLCACTHFAAELITVTDGVYGSGPIDSFRAITALTGTLSVQGGSEGVSLKAGGSVVVPASLGEYQLSGDGSAITAYVPELARDVVNPLLQEGIARERIVALAGNAREDIERVLKNRQNS